MSIAKHNRWLRRRAPLYFILTMLVLSTLTYIRFSPVQPVSASPGPGGGAYDSHPTSHTSAGWTITDPTYAYDNNWTSPTEWLYDSVRGSAGSLRYEVATFSTTGAPTTETIRRVDVCIRYNASASGVHGYIIQLGLVTTYVDLLTSATGDAHSIPPTGYDVWGDPARPGGGTWAWTDMTDLKIRVTNPSRQGPGPGATFRIFEAWVAVISGANMTFMYPFNFADPTLTPETPLTIRPDGDGTCTDWTGDYTDWNEADPHDGDSHYVSTGYEWYYETSTLQNHGAQTWSIAKVEINIWARNTTNTDEMVVPILWIGGNEYWGPMYTFTNETSGGTYVKFTAEWALNPADDNYWNWTAIDALEAGVVSYTENSWDAGLEIRVTQLYVEVTGPLLEVGIWTNYVENLWLLQFEMTFNPEVINGVWYLQLERKAAIAGPFLGSEGGTVQYAGEIGWNNTLGRLFMFQLYLAETDDPTCPDGTGMLARVFFEVVGKGESNLRFTDITGLMRPPPPSADWIAKGRAYVQDGYFRNADLADLSTASYTSAAQGVPDPNVPIEGYNVTFDATGSTPGAQGSSIVTYKWYFWRVYHGAFYQDWGVITDSVTTQNFTVRGTWNVTLIVIDDAGYVGIKETYITIYAHDIFFLDITTNATVGPLPPAVIPLANIGDILEVNVTAVNQGDFTETFNVTCRWEAFWELQAHYGLIGVGTQYNINLAAGANTTVTFYWDTTGCNITHPDRYGIRANASAVPYEYDLERDPTKLADNEFSASGPRIRLHDIAVTEVTTNATSVTPGEFVEVNVTVVNQGDYNETSITVTAYYDETAISPAQTIYLTTNYSFADTFVEWEDNHTITLAFLWDTSGVTPGDYTIKANTSTVPNDYDPNDNTFIFGTVTVAGVVPEFPFGAALEIALVTVIIYVWWRKDRRKNGSPAKTFSNYQRGKPLNVSKLT